MFQHIGAPAKPVVQRGDEVKVGTLLAEAGGFVSAPIYSSVSGKVSKVDAAIDASGLRRAAIIVDVAGDEWEEGIDRSTDLVTMADRPELAAAMPDGYFDLEHTVLPAGYSMTTGFDGGVNATNQLPNRFMCGYSTKMTTPFHYPDAQYQDKATYQLAGTGGKTFTDQYFFRLAEAYLLRAEAYVNLGKKAEAAADINVLRTRAKAKAVTADQMDIDFILDERLRELVCEEKRRLTLSRVGKLAERIKKYNPYFNAANSADKKDYDAHFDLFPIPLSAIQANKDGVLEQNPGY